MKNCKIEFPSGSIVEVGGTYDYDKREAYVYKGNGNSDVYEVLVFNFLVEPPVVRVGDYKRTDYRS